MTALMYRPDIDGLRTLAVLPVILFHAGATWMPGGFIGVDIFFVISGYLISAIILREVQAGEFSFLRFYERRVRRIIPALLVVLLVTVAVFQIIALPDQAQGTAESAIAALLSISNFYFWRESGYFAPTAEYLPLLHTWSLAVEEQFYLIFPVILLAIWKLRLPVRWVLVIGTIAAFIIGLWLSINKPSVAYYLLPARAWELAIGAVIASGAVPQIRGAVLREMVPAIGVGMILFSIFWIRSDMIFPGWVALIPCFGAAMVIHADGHSWVARRLLAKRPMVFIGRLSYSLYLWHWPVLVALRMRLLTADLPLAIAIIGVASTFLLAWLSWRFIERPFRNRQIMTTGTMSKALVTGSATLGLTAALSLIFGGFPSRLSERGHALLSGATDTAHYQFCPEGAVEDACEFGDETAPLKLLVIGDSQTPALYSAFDALASSHGIRGALYWHSACPLLDGAWREGDGYKTPCFDFRARVFQQIEMTRELRAIVLAGSWQGQLGNGQETVRHPLVDSSSTTTGPAEAAAVLVRSLGSTLDRLASQGLMTVVLGSAPGAGFDVPRILALGELNGVDVPPGTNIETVRQNQSEIDLLLASVVSGRTNASYVPLWDLFCSEEKCLVAVGNTAIYSDGGHLTATAVADFLSPNLIKRVEAILGQRGPDW